VKEIPFVFGVRVAGESKLDTGVAVQYFLLLADKTVGRVLPIGFAILSAWQLRGARAPGSSLGTLPVMGRGFPVSQGTAALCAMSLNFFLNNKVTYSDRRLRGAQCSGGCCSCGSASVCD